jgi:hypothetical protein
MRIVALCCDWIESGEPSVSRRSVSNVGGCERSCRHLGEGEDPVDQGTAGTTKLPGPPSGHPAKGLVRWTCVLVGLAAWPDCRVVRESATRRSASGAVMREVPAWPDWRRTPMNPGQSYFLSERA